MRRMNDADTETIVNVKVLRRRRDRDVPKNTSRPSLDLSRLYYIT